MIGKRIGYIRVSTADQSPDRQLVGIQLDKVFTDYASGITVNRPQFQAMLEYAREDDIIFVHSMDRLARNVRDLLSIIDELKRKGIQITFLKENLTFGAGNSSPMSDLLLLLIGAIAQFEHSLIKERQMEGVAIAKAKGKFKGSKKKLNTEKIQMMKDLLLTRKSKSRIAEELGVSRYTLYRYMKVQGIEVQELSWNKKEG